MSHILEAKNLLEKLIKEQKPVVRFNAYNAPVKMRLVSAGKPMKLEEVEEFEKTHGISLPQEYKDFLINVASYVKGLTIDIEPLKNTLWHLDNPKVVSLDFPYENDWNPNKPEDMLWDDFDNYYGSEEHISGTLKVGAEGCGYNTLLIVNGKSKGEVWMDGRVSDQGIYPYKNPDGSHESFLDWVKSLFEYNMERVKNLS